jgi:hypothetical protein
VHLGEVANQCEVCLTYPAFVMAIQTLLNCGDIFHTLQRHPPISRNS